MKLTASVPVRIDLTGGATDVSPFKENEGGRIVNFAIDLAGRPSVEMVATTSASRAVVLSSDSLGHAEEITSWDELLDFSTPHRLLKAMIASWLAEWRDFAFAEVLASRLGGGLACTVSSGVPVGSGLGTSGAIGVAFVAILEAARGVGDGALDREGRLRLATMANAIEHSDLRITSGGQDQIAAVLGGCNDIVFKTDGVLVSTVDITPAGRRGLEDRSLIVYTGRSRVSGQSLDRMMTRYTTGDEKTTAALRGVKDLADPVRSALEEGRVSEVGQVLRRSWDLRRNLHDEMTTVEIDRLLDGVDHLIEGGAACGAGGGGCCYLIAKPDARSELRARVDSMGYQSYGMAFNDTGLRLVADT